MQRAVIKAGYTLQSTQTQLHRLDITLISLCMSKLQHKHQSMKRRRLLLSLPHLPTITETLEDLPLTPSSSQSTQSSQSLEDYMTSIQALARPVEAPSCGPVRLQRSPRLRQFSKAQMKLSVSASVPRGSPRTLRTSRPSSLNLNSSTEDFSLRMSRERDCKGKDPVDWLFGQIRT
ncbi:protein DEPP-like [Archocentrus centrarchus]|uniref:protein DEPP-like n=1 Tax=Archocentrus centrarchus TaxID=63155 RepID=UPI0011E9C4F4|nr:protein DEPP-like [Archocentrus centrarchus]